MDLPNCKVLCVILQGISSSYMKMLKIFHKTVSSILHRYISSILQYTCTKDKSTYSNCIPKIALVKHRRSKYEARQLKGWRPFLHYYRKKQRKWKMENENQYLIHGTNMSTKCCNEPEKNKMRSKLIMVKKTKIKE